MTRIRNLTGCVSLALVLMGLFAGGASAHEWRINSLELERTHEVSWYHEFQFTNVEPGRSEEWVCPLKYWGTVEQGGLGEVTAVANLLKNKIVECKAVTGKVCESPYKIEAQNLPWHLEVATINGHLRYQVLGAGKEKEPRWDMKCKVVGINISWTCPATVDAGLRNASHGVEFSYDVLTPRAKCEGERTKVELESTGTALIEPLEGGLLSVE